MKFTLTYEGQLQASGNKPKNQNKWEIRKQLHPQLVDLWESHPALQWASLIGEQFPLGGSVHVAAHHSDTGEVRPPYVTRPAEPGETQRFVNLNEEIDKFGRKFRPLVRETYALHCGLKIVFLRKEAPGAIYQGGDLDGRLKTLIDALAMPQHREQVLADPDAPDPMFCLLEDDAMVSGLQVESERLLGAGNQSNDYAHLLIEVDVRVRLPAPYNESFLGG